MKPIAMCVALLLVVASCAWAQNVDSCKRQNPCTEVVSVVKPWRASCYVSAKCVNNEPTYEFVTVPRDPQVCEDYFECLIRSPLVSKCRPFACRQDQDWRVCLSLPSLDKVCKTV